MFEQFSTMLSGPEAPDPHDIAETVAKLIATPKGDRPGRTVVGAGYGADTLNDATEPVQASTVEAFGRFLANQFRLLLHALAYQMFVRLRDYLHGTPWHKLEIETLRLGHLATVRSALKKSA